MEGPVVPPLPTRAISPEGARHSRNSRCRQGISRHWAVVEEAVRKSFRHLAAVDAGSVMVAQEDEAAASAGALVAHPGDWLSRRASPALRLFAAHHRRCRCVRQRFLFRSSTIRP